MATQRATSYVTEDPSFVKIGNEHLELGFDKTWGGGLDSIMDKATGLDMRSNKAPPPLLFLMLFWNGTGMELTLQWDAQTITYGTETGGDYARATLTYERLLGYDLNVTVVVTIEDGSRTASMRLSIANDETFVVKYIAFPIVWGLGKIGQASSDDTLFYPMGDGILMHDPLSNISAVDITGKYPGEASVQLMLHYDKDEAGLYMATYDTSGHPKELQLASMEWAAEKHLVAMNKLFFPESNGNDLFMDYDAIIGTFNGDWYTAAAMYKEWAETTPFVEGGKVFEDKDTPEWFRNTSIIQMVNRDDPAVQVNSLPKIVEVTEAFQGMTGLNTTVMIHGWEGNGAWVGPDYFPPSEGETAFKDAMADLKAKGDRGFVYISGTVWRITRDDIGYADPDHFNTTGLPWVALNETGQPTFDPFYETLGWHSARMDPMTPYWHDKVVDNSLDSLGLGVQVVQVDEFPIGSIYPCYNASHGHPVGYSKDIASAYMDILDDIQVEGDLIEPDMILSTEEPNELFLPYIDTYVSRDNAPEVLLYGPFVDTHGDKAEFIPFFSFVYHEYVTSFGEHLMMEKSYPVQFYDQIARGLARTFVQGEIQNAIGAYEDDLRPGLVELYNRTAVATATYGNKYLIEGAPMPPPSITVPKKEVDWYNYFQGVQGTPIHEHVVLDSAWKADDGDLGLVLVNWDRGTHAFDVEVGPYDLPDGNYTIFMTRNGERSVFVPRTALPVTLNISMDENDVVLIEVGHSPDLSVTDDDLVLGAATVLTNEEIRLNLTVHGTGTMASGPFEVAFYMNGSLMTEPVQVGTNQSVADLGTDENLTVGVIWNTTGLFGQFDLSASVDIANTVPETDEDNNTATINVTVLPRPRSNLTVTVVDNATDDPIQGAVLDLYRIEAGGQVPVTSNLTNASGMALFIALGNGSYRVHARFDGYFDVNGTIGLPEGVEEAMDLRMDSIPVPPRPPDTLVSGTVIDNATNITVNGANVTIFDIRNQSAVAFAMTNITGDYSITNISAGNYTITASKEGYYVMPKNLTVPYNDSFVRVDFRLNPIKDLPRTGNLTGFAFQNGTNKPLENITVFVLELYVWTQTDEDGEYLLKGLREGTYTVYGYNLTWMAEVAFITIIAGRTVHHNFTLYEVPRPPPDPVITGNVTDEKGNPVAGATVLQINAVNGQNVTTDENGSFRMVDLLEGSYVFKVSKDGYISNITDSIYVRKGDAKDLNITIRKRNDSKPPPSKGFFLVGKAADACVIVVSVVIALALFQTIWYLTRKVRAKRKEEKARAREEKAGVMVKDGGNKGVEKDGVDKGVEKDGVDKEVGEDGVDKGTGPDEGTSGGVLEKEDAPSEDKEGMREEEKEEDREEE